MFAVADLVDFRADEFAGLRPGRLAFAFVLAGFLDRLPVRHRLLLRWLGQKVGQRYAIAILDEANALAAGMILVGPIANWFNGLAGKPALVAPRA